MAKILRRPDVEERTGLSTTDIYAGMKVGTFPKSVPLGKRTVGWVEDEIDAWIQAKIVARDAGTARRNPAGPGRARKGTSVESAVAQ